LSAVLKSRPRKLTGNAKSSRNVQIADCNGRAAPNASCELRPEGRRRVETNSSDKVDDQKEDVGPKLPSKEIVSQERMLGALPLPEAVNDERGDADDESRERPLVRPRVRSPKGDANEEEDDACRLEEYADPIDLGKCLALGAVSKSLTGFRLRSSADSKTKSR
jgi:hypothetical protein